MPQSVVTELVIDADTAGADRFSQSMDSAKSSAANTTLAVAGVGAAFIASMIALRGFVDYVGGVNKQLVDIAENATNAGMSTKEFQETLFAAKANGLSDKDFVSGLDKIGADLTAASVGITDFGTLFKQNGLSIKDTNGQLITTKAALNDIAALMENATPQVQLAIAKIVGLSKDWVPFLRDGVDALDEQKAAAAGLGAVIDDNIIQKARDFDNQWHLAIATWDLQFKASLAEILPLLVQLAGIATSVINGVGQISGFFSRSLTPTEQMSSSDLDKQVDSLARLSEIMQGIGEQAFRAKNLKGALGLPEDSDLRAVDAMQDKLQDLSEEKQQAVDQRAHVLINGGTTLPPGTQATKDAVDQAIDSLQKHTQAQLADTLAVGLGDAALVGFRADAAETAAVLKNGGKETDAQVDKFSDLKDAAVAAADALAKAKVASAISVGQQTAFLSAGDVAIAQQLKGLYGDNIPAALASTEFAALRVNAAFKEVSSAIDTNLTSGLTDIVSGTKSVSQGFKDMESAIVKAIEQMIIKITIVEPLMRSLQSAASGLGIGNLFGSAGTGAINANGSIAGAIGPTSVGGAPLVGFADGTDNAPGGWSMVGERGPERMYVPPGAQIIPNGGRASNDNGGNRTPNIIINNHTDATPTTATNSNGDITITFKKMMDDAVGSSLSSGTGMRVLSKQYGVNQFAGQ